MGTCVFLREECESLNVNVNVKPWGVFDVFAFAFCCCGCGCDLSHVIEKLDDRGNSSLLLPLCASRCSKWQGLDLLRALSAVQLCV